MNITNYESLPALDEAITARINAGTLACASYAVCRGENVLYMNFLGHSDVEAGVKLRRDNMFRLASMTKPVTGIAVMQMVERGKLSLDDNVSRYIPSFASPRVGHLDADGALVTTPANNEIEIRDLLNHTNGLGSGVFGDAYCREHFPIKDGDTLQNIVPLFGSQPLDFDPRTSCFYSATQAFDVAAYIVSMLADMDYADYVNKEILAPLGCKDITFHPTEEQWDRLVQMYDTKDGKLVHCKMPRHTYGNFPVSYTSGGASLLGTLEDYIRISGMFNNRGEFDGVRILKPETVDLMSSVSTPPCCDNDVENWGLSMRVVLRRIPDVQDLNAGAFGWSGAYGTHFFIDKQSGLHGVYMSNMANCGGSGAATAREFEHLVITDHSNLLRS